MNSKDFKKSALEQLNGRWTTPVLVTLVVTAITMVLTGIALPWEYYADLIVSVINEGNYIPDYSSFPFARYIVFMFLIMLIVPVVEIAQLSIFPVLFKTKEPVKFSEFISGFSLWGKALGAFWWQYLWLMLWALAGAGIGMVVCGIIGGVITAIVSAAGGLSTYTIGYTVGCSIAAGGYIGMLVVIVIKAYEYSLTELALVDNENFSPVQALKISKKITKGYKWKLFCLDFSFIGWVILCAFFTIGQLWLVPYQTAAKYAAYIHILNEYNEKMNSETPAEPQTRAIEDEPVSAEVDTSDGNEI